MDVRVHGKNMRVANAVNDLALDKIGHASRIFDGVPNNDHDHRFKVEKTSHTAGHTVRVQSMAPDAFSAIDLAADKFERQLRRLKERLIQRSRKRDHKLLNGGSFASDEDEEDGPASVVRTKRFAMRPMTAEEAGLQMEMLGHDFFFFLDAESGKYCVLYHRADGDLGLIEPE